MNQKLTEVKSALYDTISECNFFSIILYDRQGIIRDMNDYTATLLGKSREALIGTSIREFFPAEDYASHEQDVEKLFRGEIESLPLRHRFFRGDGVTAFGGGIARIVKVDGYDPVVLSVFKDITDVVEAQNKVLEKNAVLNMVVRNSELLTFKYLPQTKTMVNEDITVQTLGLGKVYTDMPDSFIRTNVSPDFAEDFREAFRKIDDGEEMSSVEVKSLIGNVWFRQTMRVAKRDENGKPLNVVGIVENISALKQEQENRQAAEQQNRDITEFAKLILDNTLAVLVLLDEESRLMFASPGGFQRPEGFAKLKQGMDVGEVFDTIFFGILDKEEVQKIRDGVQQTIATKEKFDHKFSITYKENTIHISLNVIPAMRGERLNGVLLTMNNVTDLENAREEAESSNKAKSAFLANMSHEIRTPMNAIIGISEVALGRDISAETRNDLQTIQNAGAGLLSIINDILDFSKVESGKFEVIPVDYSLPSVLMDVSNMISTKLTSKPVHLFMNLDPSIPFNLVGDDIRIKQILMNLLGNAVKFTNEGHIELRVEGEFIDKTNYKLTFKVIDTGIGIKKEDIGRLFGTFSQVDTRKNRSITGSGLGLAISKSFAQMMGGDVQVESTYGKGTTFIVTIMQGVKRYDKIGEVKRKDEIRVLLLEQDSGVIDSISRNLDHMGVSYEVCTDPGHMRTYEGMTHVILKRGNLEELRYKLEFMFPKQNILLWMENDETPSNDFLAYKQLQLPLIALQLLNVFNGDEIVRTMRRKNFDSSQIVPLTFAKVLVVDDNLTNLQVAKGLMAPYKMQVDSATSGFKAIEMVKNNKYDLVFMDHMMPEMDGIETVQHIRELEGEYYKTLPIVALTANAMSDAKEQFMSSGMDDFLSKPIEVRELNRVLKKYVQSKAPAGYLAKVLEKKNDASASVPDQNKAEDTGIKKPVVPAQSLTLSASASGNDAFSALLTQNNLLLQQNMLLLQQIFGQTAPGPVTVQLPETHEKVPAEPDMTVEPDTESEAPGSTEDAPENDNMTEASDTEACLGDPIPGVNMEEALEKLGGMVDIYHEILATYSNDIRIQEQDLKRMYAEKDVNNFTITVHAVKSASRSIGADDLGELAYSLEKHGKAGEWKAIEAEFDPFMDELSRMVKNTAAYVEKYISKGDGSEEKQSKDGFDPADVEALKKCCAEMDYMTAEEILLKMDTFTYPDHEAELLKKMLGCCGEFEYDELETTVKEL